VLADPSQARLRRAARLLTVVVAVAAAVVGAQGYSVLTLFLFADLLGTASFIPFLHGLYSPRATESGALVASLAGLAVGLAYFPPLRGALAAVPGLEPALPTPSFTWSFVGATVLSGVLTLVAARATDARFDLDALAREIRTLDEPEPGPDAATDGGDRGGVTDGDR